MDEEQYPIGRRGFSKLFHVETLRRIPVVQNQETRDAIGATTFEGRIFPQALSDEFGKLEQVDSIILTVVGKAKHFATEEDARLLEVDVIGTSGMVEHRFLVNMSDLEHFHQSGWHSFQAGETAKELVRLFRQLKGY